MHAAGEIYNAGGKETGEYHFYFMAVTAATRKVTQNYSIVV